MWVIYAALKGQDGIVVWARSSLLKKHISFDKELSLSCTCSYIIFHVNISHIIKLSKHQLRKEAHAEIIKSRY